MLISLLRLLIGYKSLSVSVVPCKVQTHAQAVTKFKHLTP